MIRLICALVLVLAISSPSLGQQSFVGTYKLISLDYEIDGKPMEGMGKAPHGYLVLTPTRAIMFYTSPDRKFGTSAEDKVKLYDSLVAWAGVYRIEGNKLIYAVDTSWVEHLNGQNHALNIRFEGNRLMTTTDPRPWPKDPSKTMVNRRIFEKIE
jgi:hypothetical protein